MDIAQYRWDKMNSVGPVIAGAGFLVLTQAFSAYAPVTVGMTITDLTRTELYIEGEVKGRKIKDCAVVANSFVGWQKVDSVWHETPFAFIDDPSPNSTRPDGWAVQAFDIWRWYDVSPEATDVKMSLQHDCDGRLEVTQAAFSIDPVE